MINLKNIAFKGYKSFKNYATLEEIGNVNLIIGKNNSGKSSILDVLEIIFEKDFNTTQRPQEIILTQTLTDDVIAATFQSYAYSIYEVWSGRSDYEYGVKYINQDLSYRILNKNQIEITNNFENGRAKKILYKRLRYYIQNSPCNQ